MTMVRISTVGMIVLCVHTLLAQEVPVSERLVVTQKSDSYEMAVPVSRLLLTIPKRQLLPSKNNVPSPRYFSFEEPGRTLVISGWFEAESAFLGLDLFWAGEARALRQNGLTLEHVSQEQIGNWQAIFYDILLQGTRSSVIRAEWIQSGTWLDLHLAVTADQAEAEGRKALRDVLGTIHVAECVHCP